MGISLRLRLDNTTDSFVLEFESGAVARTVPLPPALPGGKPVTLDLDEDGYVVSVSVPGMAAIFEELLGAKRTDE